MAIFSKILTKTDIEKRLSIPSKHLKSFPCFNFQARDESGKVWPLQCTIRKEKYLKPVISRGWLEFVRSNKVQISDKITFYGESRGQYRIKVKKPVKIFGAVIGYAPKRNSG
ncbi:hypothetical protein REPUB_Repub04eG0013100 [Reevesia pubescens]